MAQDKILGEQLDILDIAGDIAKDPTASAALAAGVDHDDLQNSGSFTHGNIDTHINNGGFHFLETAIDHVNIQNIGSNTHDDIDDHILDASIHSSTLNGLSDVYAGSPSIGQSIIYGGSPLGWHLGTGGGVLNPMESDLDTNGFNIITLTTTTTTADNIGILGGDTGSGTPGTITIKSGSSTSTPGGNVWVYGGVGDGQSGYGGNIGIYCGANADTTPSVGGSDSGRFAVYAGDAPNGAAGGGCYMYAGKAYSGSGSKGGHIVLGSGQGYVGNDGGGMWLLAGDAYASGNGGQQTLRAGNSDSGAGGDLILESGSSSSATGGTVYIRPLHGYDGGDTHIVGGNSGSVGGAAGSITLHPGNGTGGATDGNIEMHHVFGVVGEASIQLWKDTDTGHTTGNYVALNVSSALSANLTLTLPAIDGSNGQSLQTNASGVLTFGGPPTFNGTGDPEGTVPAIAGSMYTDAAGGAGTTLYVKESGSSTVGWIPIATSFLPPKYTVGTLPTVVEGGMIYVTDATAFAVGSPAPIGSQCFGRAGSPPEWIDVTTGIAVV